MTILKTNRTPLLLEMGLSKEIREKSPFGINGLNVKTFCFTFLNTWMLLSSVRYAAQLGIQTFKRVPICCTDGFKESHNYENRNSPPAHKKTKLPKTHRSNLCSVVCCPAFIRKHIVCVEVLRPSQPNGVMSSAVSLPNHTFTGQA